MESIQAGNTYTGAELISYASKRPGALLFYENSSSRIRTDDGSLYDIIAIERGYLQMQGSVNKEGELITLHLHY